MITAVPLSQEYDPLTETERTLLKKLCEGLTFRQIDSELGLEAGTAHRMRKPLFRKIGVRTRHEASAAIYPSNHIKQSELRRLLSEHHKLAQRECDVLIFLFRFPELGRKQISEQLGISENTTRLTINRINKKLGVRTRAAAIYKIRTALLPGAVNA